MKENKTEYQAEREFINSLNADDKVQLFQRMDFTCQLLSKFKAHLSKIAETSIDSEDSPLEKEFIMKQDVSALAAWLTNNPAKLLSKFKQHLIESGDLIQLSDKPFLVKVAKHPYYPVLCQCCGWLGSSGDCDGGGQIADTGDYGDFYCPKCGQIGPDETEVNEYWVVEPETNAVTISDEEIEAKFPYYGSGRFESHTAEGAKQANKIVDLQRSAAKWMKEQLNKK